MTRYGGVELSSDTKVFLRMTGPGRKQSFGWVGCRDRCYRLRNRPEADCHAGEIAACALDCQPPCYE